MIREPSAAVRRLLLTPQVIHPEVKLSRRRLIRDTHRGRKHLPLRNLDGLHDGGPRVLAHRNTAIKDPLECRAEGSQMVMAHQESAGVLNVDQVLNRRPRPVHQPITVLPVRSPTNDVAIDGGSHCSIRTRVSKAKSAVRFVVVGRLIEPPRW